MRNHLFHGRTGTKAAHVQNVCASRKWEVVVYVEVNFQNSNKPKWSEVQAFNFIKNRISYANNFKKDSPTLSSLLPELLY